MIWFWNQRFDLVFSHPLRLFFTREEKWGGKYVIIPSLCICKQTPTYPTSKTRPSSVLTFFPAKFTNFSAFPHLLYSLWATTRRGKECCSRRRGARRRARSRSTSSVTSGAGWRGRITTRRRCSSTYSRGESGPASWRCWYYDCVTTFLFALKGLTQLPGPRGLRPPYSGHCRHSPRLGLPQGGHRIPLQIRPHCKSIEYRVLRKFSAWWYTKN